MSLDNHAIGSHAVALRGRGSKLIVSFTMPAMVIGYTAIPVKIDSEVTCA